ncbi:MAG: glycoside hydrolase family 2 protein [Bacteroidales bacterium]|nr:glycoside hydrolase family 2 protein [Bacteroidales bacterium]MBN2633407.1 glycoside hydrolase family 2 protein [Bacteroidales bacterium]
MKRLIVLFILSSQLLAAQDISWPEITRMNKPWTRWWWPGSIVTEQDISYNMEKNLKAGLGGMEITCIYGVKGYEDRFINYLSPEWMKMFTYTLGEAERRDMGIDLANASGWPFGGPWVSPDDACKNINYKTYTLKGGEKLTEKVEFVQQPLLRPVGVRPDISKLIDPIGKNKDLQLYALDQIRFEKPLPLYILVAYSDAGEIIDLTDNVTSDRVLEWTAPEGNWTLYALFQGWHGKLAERAGPGGEGDVIDHFSGKAISNFLAHFDTVFKDYNIESLRGYFNDSYEVDDASGESNWTGDLFYEFYNRRAYDLAAYLPALFQKDTPELNARVLSDYRQTISDLILDKFTTGWRTWANRQGKTIRNQAHGSPANILDLYAASDIPETEGREITRFKFASSAANVTGKPYIACEAATWLDEHFLSDLFDIREAVDLFFLGGINHVFYHGTCFSPKDAPWPGFHFYAAVELNPSNSLWNDSEALNRYVARVQSFLQQGMPDNNILLYFPVFDRYADYGRSLLQHFDGISPAFKGTPFMTAAEEMIEKGYAYDFISDLQIKNSVTGDGLIMTEGNAYRTLILPGSKYIPLETFAQILKMANEGATILLYGEWPENVAGLASLDAKNAAFERFKAGVSFGTTNNPEVEKATYGKGMICKSSNLDQLLPFAGIRRERMTDNGISFVRRANDDGSTYFILNKGEKAFDGWLPLEADAASAALFNPSTEVSGLAKGRKGGDGKYEIYLRIFPGESFIVRTYDETKKAAGYPFYDATSTAQEIPGKWKVEFVEGGPAMPPSVEISGLKSWTDFGGDAVKDFSGTAEYSISFMRPSGKADAWSLNLGKVCESARVILNGSEVGILIGPEYKITLTKKQLKKKNTLVIKVSNLMANRISYMDRNNIEWKKFYNINMAARLRQNTKNGIFDASAWQPLESGLIGPVTITPMKVVK